MIKFLKAFLGWLVSVTLAAYLMVKVVSNGVSYIETPGETRKLVFEALPDFLIWLSHAPGWVTVFVYLTLVGFVAWALWPNFTYAQEVQKLQQKYACETEKLRQELAECKQQLNRYEEKVIEMLKPVTYMNHQFDVVLPQKLKSLEHEIGVLSVNTDSHQTRLSDHDIIADNIELVENQINAFSMTVAELRERIETLEVKASSDLPT